MKARVWFEAQGRRMYSRGFYWAQAKKAIGLYNLPHWAQSAFSRGFLLQAPKKPTRQNTPARWYQQ